MKATLSRVLGFPSLTDTNNPHDFLIQSAAEVYCEIWAEPPWNETHWTKDGVVQDIRSALSRFGAVAYVAVRRSGLSGFAIGFTWGYPIDSKELLAISQNEHVAALTEIPTFYIAELGVNNAYRGEGIGFTLSEKLLSRVREQGLHRVILRTHIHATAARKLYEKLGFRELPFADGTHSDRTYWIITL